MGPLEGWKLADELNVYQIVLLITGNDPSDFEDCYVEKWPEDVKREMIPFLTAIKNAARSGRLQFSEQSGYNGEGTDWGESLIGIESLRVWMREKNISDGFFVSDALEKGRVADPTSGFYAPKLAAAIRAWTEVTSDPAAINGKSPKKALEVWLRKHASEYGLTNKDGNPNALGIEEICKVANWKPSGGASPTAVAVPPTPQAKPTIGLGGKVRRKPSLWSLQSHGREAVRSAR